MAHPVATEFRLTKKLMAWAARAAEQGLDLRADLQAGIDDPAVMRRIVAYIQAGAPAAAPTAGSAFDAVHLLGFGEASTERPPEPAPGEIVLRYGGWSLTQLRDTEVGRRLMWDQDWYERCDWASACVPEDVYRLRVPVPGSTNKTFDEQQATLPHGEEVAPVVLVASALLCLRLQGRPDPMKGGWTRCRERTSADHRVELGWHDGRLYVRDYWVGSRSPCAGVSAVRAS